MVTWKEIKSSWSLHPVLWTFLREQIYRAWACSSSAPEYRNADQNFLNVWCYLQAVHEKGCYWLLLLLQDATSTYYSRWLLVDVCCLLFVICCFLFVPCCLLVVVVACCLLFCWLLVVSCLLSVVCAVCCLLFVAYCLLCVVCCLLVDSIVHGSKKRSHVSQVIQCMNSDAETWLWTIYNSYFTNPSWWFQPIWKILVKLGIFPK